MVAGHARMLVLALASVAGLSAACLAAMTEPEPAMAGTRPALVEAGSPATPGPTVSAHLDALPVHARVDVKPVQPPPSPLDATSLLADAERAMADLGLRRRAIRHLRGPHPEASGLDAAYADGRALAYEGDLEQIRRFMALAKFGVDDPTSATQTGPLARYDLCVTRKGEVAWLHVIVPPAGLATERGQHYKAESGARWVLLSDRARPGVDYVPFKRSASPSLARQWGETKFIDTLVELAAEYRTRTGVRLGIGDLSHVTGGKMKDHWTHRLGVDVDLYLLDFSDGDDAPRLVFHHYQAGRSIWSTRPDGKGERERPPADKDDTPSAARLRALADLVLERDQVAYFVHNDPTVLGAFDEQASQRKPGRRFLHARNKGYWPRHADHVHLRWAEGPLPVGTTPRP